MPNVPIVVGLSRDDAVAALTQAGLIEGIETNVISPAPVKSVTRSIPVAGTQLGQGASVDLDVSAGLRRPRWWENPSSFILSVLAILIFIALLIGILSSFRGAPLLQELGKFEIARGLITFLIAFTTVGIALIIVVSTVVLNDSTENDKRFDRGKQVLSVLIGVLGTIVGFYFAAGNKSVELSITSASLPVATVGRPYPETVLNSNGGSPPFKWTVKPELPKGLHLSEPGVISGTPESVGSDKSFTFTVVDSTGKSESRSLDLKVQSQDTSPPDASKKETVPQKQ